MNSKECLDFLNKFKKKTKKKEKKEIGIYTINGHQIKALSDAQACILEARGIKSVKGGVGIINCLKIDCKDGIL